MKVSEKYPITQVTYPDGLMIEGVSHDHLRLYTAPIEYDELMSWLTGQTYGDAGIYVGDLQRWMDRR